MIKVCDHPLQIRTSNARKHQDRHHERHKCTSRSPDVHAKRAQIPRSSPESIADKENANEDGYRKRHKGCNCSDGEQRAGCDGPTEDKKDHENTEYSIEPDCVDRSMGMSVDALYPPGTRKAIITSVGEGDSGSGDLNGTLAKGPCGMRWTDLHTMQP